MKTQNNQNIIKPSLVSFWGVKKEAPETVLGRLGSDPQKPIVITKPVYRFILKKNSITKHCKNATSTKLCVYSCRDLIFEFHGTIIPGRFSALKRRSHYKTRQCLRLFQNDPKGEKRTTAIPQHKKNKEYRLFNEKSWPPEISDKKYPFERYRPGAPTH